MIGKFKARAREWAFDRINDKERICVLFQIIGGEHEGKSVTWHGYFTEKTIDRTLDSLRYCGWSSDSIAQIDDIGNNEVEIDVVEEEFTNDRGEVKTASKVNWVNRLQKLNLKDEMKPSDIAAFAAKLRGKTVAHKQKSGAAPQQGGQRSASSQQSRDNGGFYGPPPDDRDSPY